MAAASSTAAAPLARSQKPAESASPRLSANGGAGGALRRLLRTTESAPPQRTIPTREDLAVAINPSDPRSHRSIRQHVNAGV